MVNLYGTAFPLKMDLDRQILSRYYPIPFFSSETQSSLFVISVLKISK